LPDRRDRDDPERLIARGRSLASGAADTAKLRDRVRGRLFGAGGASGATVAAADSRAAGAAAKRVGARYRIEALLGEGGMGAVFRAYDEATDRHVALKRSTHRRAEVPFRREFHTLVTLSHPNIVEAFDFGLDEEGPYYTMELLPGAELRSLGRADMPTVCRVVRDVASALAFLHARRLVHRDVTVRNIGRSEAGVVKLIDFGLLATAGADTELAGTPPHVAPEMFHGLPLAPGVDLFALGAVAYFLLTGKHAFPARSFEQLERMQRAPPEPLAALRPDLPAPLVELVARLLSLDPLARPSSAVEVMDRLARWLPASTATDAAAERDVVRGYLASTTFVGRQSEMELLRDRARAASIGQGGAVFLEAPSGSGKTRLLRELAIESKVGGALVVVVAGDARQKPYGAVRAAIAALLDAAPEPVAAAARRHGGPLAAIVPELARDAAQAKTVVARLEPNEQRLLVQKELQVLLFDVARQRPLVLLVDDVQRADESSLAVLSSIAAPPPGVPLLLAAACATDEVPRAASALTDLARKSHLVSLRGLGRSDVQALVRALFGEVPNSAKLADVIGEVGGGSPLLCTEIARHLVESHVVRYVDGMWVIPDDVAVAALPKRLDDAMDARLRSFSAHARRVAAAIAVYGRPISLELAVGLGAPLAESTVFAGIDELVAGDVLIGAGSSFAISHRAAQSAILRSLDEEATRTWHSQVADALALELEADESLDGEVGHHMLRGGRAREAAPLLYRAGKRLYETQSLRDAIPVLEAALAAYGDDSSEGRVIGELRQLLIVAGAMADRSLVLRQGDRAFADAWTRAGLDVGERVARFLGRPLGLVAAMVASLVRRQRAPRGAKGARPIEAVRNALIVATASFAAYAHLRAFERMEELLAHLRLFDVFRKTVPHTAYRVSLAMYELTCGRRASTRAHCDASLAALESDRGITLAGYERLSAEAAIRNTRAWVAVIDQDPAFEGDIAAIERMDLPSYGFSCAIYRAIYHRHRGEERAAREMEERAEGIRVQLGTLWMWEGSLWQQSSLAYALTRDALGLKRCLEALTRMEEQGYLLSDYIELARANHLREHGAVDEAWERLSSLEAGLGERSVVTQDVVIAMGETALARGDHDRARELAARARSLACDPDRGLRSIRLRATRIAALADAAVAPERAFAMLDPAIAEAEQLASPSLAGTLHEAAATVALEAGDEERLARHIEMATRWFRPTQTPALIARLEQLRAIAAARAGAGRGNVAESRADGVPHALGASRTDDTFTDEGSERARRGERVTRPD
jgi:hypothetical protein